jgi:hypothetical protein
MTKASSNEFNDRKREAVMRKVVGIALATLFTLTVAAAAEEGTGRSFVLDNGTTISVSEKKLSDVAPGEQVKAMFETQAGTNVIVSPQLRAIGPEPFSGPNWAPTYGTQADSIQSE